MVPAWVAVERHPAPYQRANNQREKSGMTQPASTTTNELRFCHDMLGQEAGDAAIALVERVIGMPCPCKRGIPCPLAPPVAVPQGVVVA